MQDGEEAVPGAAWRGCAIVSRSTLAGVLCRWPVGLNEFADPKHPSRE
jgi:hypothetical protein